MNWSELSKTTPLLLALGVVAVVTAIGVGPAGFGYVRLEGSRQRAATARLSQARADLKVEDGARLILNRDTARKWLAEPSIASLQPDEFLRVIDVRD